MRSPIEGSLGRSIKRCLERLAGALQRARELVKRSYVAGTPNEQPEPSGRVSELLEGKERPKKAKRAKKSKKAKATRSKTKKSRSRGLKRKREKAKRRSS